MRGRPAWAAGKGENGDDGSSGGGKRVTARLFAGVEMGGTKCVCTLAAGPGPAVAQHRLPTTKPAETLAAIEAVLDGWMAEHRVAGLGIASFGPLDLEPSSPGYGRITATTKPGWRDTAVGGRLRRRYPVPVAIDTDVNGAALAEARWGAAEGLDSFCYITVGTGVGVGVVAAGQPLHGFGHPEAGHIHVQRAPGDGWPGACPFHGDCVEGLASGPAMAARTGRPAEAVPADDPTWMLVAHAVAGLCHNLVLTVAPRRILLGGGVMARQPQLMPLVRERLARSLGGYGIAPAIAADIERFVAPPGLGEQAGPLGAIALAMAAAAAAG